TRRFGANHGLTARGLADSLELQGVRVRHRVDVLALAFRRMEPTGVERHGREARRARLARANQTLYNCARLKRALITGVTGQDGSYLAELLLEKGYEVHGLIRRASTFNTTRIDHLYQDPHDPTTRLFLHYGDLTDGSRLVTLLEKIHPDEVYNLAAQSHVRVSFDEPEFTGLTTGLGTTRLLESIRMIGLECKYYQASSSEMFGATPPPQNEETPFYP